MRDTAGSSAAALVERVASAIPDRSQAAQVHHRLRSYVPAWQLAQQPEVLEALLAEVSSGDPLWWRPARVALLAIAARRGLAGSQEAETWLLDGGKPFLFAAAGESPHSDSPADQLQDAEALSERTLVRDACRALYHHSSSGSADCAGLSDGELVCLYDFATRVPSPASDAAWLADVAQERPATAAKTLLLNNDPADCHLACQEIAKALSSPQTLAFAAALADAGAPDLAANLSQQLLEALPEPEEAGEPEQLAQAAVGYLYRGLAAAANQPAAAVSELEKAWGRGRVLAAALARQLGQLRLAQSDPGAALAAYRLGLELAPASAEIRAAAADAMIQLERYQDALDLLGQAPDTTEQHYQLAWQRARALAALEESTAADAAVQTADLADTAERLHQAAGLLAELGQTERAIAALEQAVASAPGTADWYQELGDLYASQADWSAAENCVLQQVALDPENVPALLRLASVRRARGRHDAALEAAERASHLEPQNSHALNEWVVAAHSAGQWQTAVRAGQAALTLKPDSAQVYRLMGQSFEALNQDDEALYHLRRATQLPHEDLSASWLALAEYYHRRDDSAQAERTLLDAVREVGEQQAGSLLFRLATLYEDTGRPTEAQSAFWRAYQAGNCSSPLLTRLGQVLTKLGHHEEAIAKLEEAAAQPDADVVTFQSLALALEKGGRIAEAAAAARQAASLRPTDSQLLLDAGRLSLMDNDPVEAVTLFQEVARQQPDDASVLERLGEALEADEDWAAALDAYWSIARLDPGNPRAMHRIGAVYNRLGQYEPAVAALKEAEERLPKDPSIKDDLAEALEGAEWWDGASHVRRQAAELTPHDSERLVAWARAARQAGDIAAAEEAVARAQQLPPGSGQAVVEWALLQRDRGKATQAVQSLRDQAANSLQPAHLWEVGEALTELGEYDAAAVAYRRGAELDPEGADAQVRLGEAWVRLEDHAQALAAYRAAAQLEPSNPAHRLSVGEMHWRLDQFLEAARAWDSAHELLPEDQRVVDKLASACALSEDPAEALELSLRAAERAESAGAAAGALWREAGRAALRLGEPERARSCLVRALENSPRDPETHSLTGALAELVGRPEEALESYRRAAELQPDERAYQLQVADVLAKLGWDAAALEVWEGLVEEGDTDAALVSRLGQLGDLYSRSGRYQEAERTLRSALDHSPEDETLQLGLYRVLTERAELADYHRRAGVRVPDAVADLGQAVDRLADGDSPQDRRDSARGRLLLGDVDQAIVELNAYLDSADSPAADDLAAQRALGVAYRRAGLLDASQMALTAALGIAPDDTRTGVEMAATYLKAGQAEPARNLLERLVEQSAEDPVLLYYCAQAAHSAGDIDKAIGTLQAAVELKPENGSWQRELSGWLRGEGTALAALPYAEAALRLEPEDAQAGAELARVLADLERFKEAIPVWQEALAASPDNAGWWTALGQALVAAGQPKPAVDCFAKGVHLEPDAADSYLGWAEALLAQGDIDAARQHIDSALEMSPHLPAAHGVLGHWQAAKGSWEEALASFQTAALLSGNGKGRGRTHVPASSTLPADVESGTLNTLQDGGDQGAPVRSAQQAGYLLHVARAYWELGSPEQALHELSRAARLDPGSGAVLSLMGDIHLATGDRDMARQAYQQAAKVCPSDPHYSVQLARFLQNEGQLDQSLHWLSKALDKRPNAELWVEAAKVYEQRGQRGEQLESLYQAVTLEPENARAHFELGLAHKQRKEYKRAIEAFERAVELEPDDQQIHKQLAAVVAISFASRAGN